MKHHSQIARKPLTLLNGFTLVGMLIALSSNVWAASPGVDPWVENQLRANQTTEFIVRMDARAQTADLRHTRDFLERRQQLIGRLQETARQSQASLLERLDQLGVEYRSFWITNAVLIKGDQNLLDELMARRDIAHIHANPQVAMDFPDPEQPKSDSPDAVEWGVSLIGAPDVWAQGFDGTGVVIAGQDTGYQWDHPALINQYRGWNGVSADHNYNWHDAIHVDNSSCNGDSPFPCDDNNHGTHTMGTMVGDDGGSNQIGVAPGAKWISCRNMNAGNGTPASYIECYEWFVAPTDLNGENPDPSKAPHVINNSWSCPPSEGCNDPNVMLDVVNNVVEAGIMVVVSAGNSGS
ncbi:MAG TPA: S8 family serine peptidase, partial [Xanthomonadales bacterium]|nr:S8 family serine peptidase [Xanthomonadales bacterium]